MRALGEWTEDDLQSLIASGVQESLTLDYKRSVALDKSNNCRNEISKDVSAFANSAGGQIIYGISENNHLPESIDAGLDPAVVTREWLEQVINSTIKPRIQNLLIKLVSLHNGRVAYALDIPQATSLAPHQASDHRYYRRFNYQSVPMEDYEVRDLLRRATTPDLVLEFSIGRDEKGSTGTEATLIVSILNRSTEPAYYRVVRLFMQQTLVIRAPKDFDRRDDLFVAVNDVMQPVTMFSSNFGIPGQLPVFKEQRFRLCEIGLSLRDENMNYLIGYDVTCPGSSKSQTGHVRREGQNYLLGNLDDVA